MDTRQNRTTNHSQPPVEPERNLDSHVETVAPSPTDYQEGYVHGRASKRSVEHQRQEVSPEKSATRGLLLGIALTSLVGLTVAASFFVNQRNEDEIPPQTPVAVPSPRASQSPVDQTTVIERTTETTEDVAPTTQSPTTAPQNVQPNIQITIPSPRTQQAPTQQNPSPRTQQTPTQQNPRAGTEPTSSQNQTSSTNSSGIQRNATPQTSPAPLQNQIINGDGSTTQPNTNNTNDSVTSTPPQNQTSPGTSTRIQPNTTNSTLPGQTQNQPSNITTPTNPTNTTDLGTPEQTQNQTQPTNSGAGE